MAAKIFTRGTTEAAVRVLQRGGLTNLGARVSWDYRKVNSGFVESNLACEEGVGGNENVCRL